MIGKIKHILGIRGARTPSTDFSAFFHNASAAEKKKMLEQVVREANKDQRDLVKKYEIMKAVR
ncbi:MAG: hypothetical protein HZA25_01540 [Candidatus Niyogibacteria bacterium]|nr:hypothetical protein [Candidatus Niyogibacteria bacterium]